MKILTIAILWSSFLVLQPVVPPPQKVVTAAQVNGMWESKFGTFKILALGKQKLKIQFSGIYAYKLADGSDMANTGDGEGIATIEGNQATFKPVGAEEECAITMKFTGGKLLVEQKGTCGFGHNVSAAGTYRRTSSRKPKFENGN